MYTPEMQQNIWAKWTKRTWLNFNATDKEIALKNMSQEKTFFFANTIANVWMREKDTR